MRDFDVKSFLYNFRHDPEAAFRQLMDEYRNSIYLFCLRAINRREEAEDLTQEIFIRIWKGLSNFRGDSKLTTWMYRIAWNVCATSIDKKSRSPVNLEYDESFNKDISQTGKIILGKNDNAQKNFENKQFLEVLFNELPHLHKVILTLYYFQEQSYQEISEILDKPIGTVKATLHRAKGNLRKVALTALK